MRAFLVTALLALLVWLMWFQLAGPSPFSVIQENWEISVTMVFGSLVAGATSESGGAVAFPVLTKLLNIPPEEAKVFSLAIQSIGMTAASLVIIVMGIRIEWRIILWASLGGALGIILSSDLLAPIVPPPVLRMSFTAMISSFAITLYFLNRDRERFCHERTPLFGFREKGIYLTAGICGGVMGGLVGNGIDIITFSVMVLLFRISEKIATPTSVILMAINALVGFALHALVIEDFTPQVQAYWLAAMPIVVVGAPVGAMICTLLNRVAIARILLVLIGIELTTSLWLIPMTPLVTVTSLTTLSIFSGFYYWMYRTQTYEVSRVNT